MSKILKKIFLPLLCIVTVLCIFGLAACKKDETTTYTITVEESENGTVTSDKTEAAEGDTVTLTVTPNESYTLSELKVNDTATKVENGKATFEMPAENVTVSATFKKTDASTGDNTGDNNTDNNDPSQEPDGEGKFAVSLGTATGASVKADKSEAEKGEKVTLTVTVNYGYTLTELKVNGTELSVNEEGKAEFTMPEAAANVTLAAAMVGDVKTGEAVDGLIHTARIASDTAKSVWSASYGDEAVTFKVYVEDKRVNDNDGVELYVGRTGYVYSKLTAANYGVKVNIDGTVTHYAVAENAYAEVEEADGGLSVVSVKPWSKDGSAIDGYYAELTVSYEKLGFEEKPDEGNITALPALSNYITSSMGTTECYNGYDKANPGAYLVLTDGEWKENDYALGAGVLGGTSYVSAGANWNLSKDYPVEETELYDQREVTLKGTDRNDNNLVFFKNEGRNVYAKATFVAGNVIDEKWGKFGLMLFDGAGSKSGVFFYVDAFVGDAGDGVVRGKDLGYAPANGDYTSWSTIATNKYTHGEPITLAMAYVEARNTAFMWHVNGNGDHELVGQYKLVTARDMAIGFKSFNFELKVTDYECTNDVDAFKDILPEERAEGNALGGTELRDYGTWWNVTEDYAEDNENYADRKVTLTGHDGNDNNIYFKATEGKEAYVKATFKVTEVYAGEKWGKFGLMLFDDAVQHGTFFYVDAWVGNDGDGVLRGKQLGYNYAPNGWGNWNGLIKAGDVFDTNTKTITLEMTYANYVISMFYVNGSGESVLVNQTRYTPQSKDFIIGIKSFAYGLEVTGYTVNTDKTSQSFIDHNPLLEKENIDVLVAGDSYTEFWKNYGVWDTLTYDLTQAGKKLVDVGVGGTQVPYWNNDGQIGALSMAYNPKQILFHIGVNDIDAPTSVDEVYNRLVSLLSNYHAAFPEAKIFWVSLIPNNFYINNGGTYNAEYKQLNNRAKTLIDGLDYAEYIDVWTAFATEDGGARANLLMNDGLHLNPVYGYPLWTGIIKNALGYPRTDSETLGSNNSENAERYATPAWIYGQNGNIAELNYQESDYGKKVNTEETIYHKAAPAAELLFEAEIRSNGLYYPDIYSKVGVTLVNDDVTLFAYFETNSGVAQNGAKLTYASVVARGNVKGWDNKGANITGVGDWDWNNQAGGAISESNIMQDYRKIGIAKVGTTIYLLVDGKVIAQKDNFPGVTAESKFIAGVTVFNRNVEIKTVSHITDSGEIDNLLAVEHTITVPTYEGVTITVENGISAAKRGNVIKFTADVGENKVEKVCVTYGGKDHELTADEGTYSFTMPDEDVTIKITFEGKFEIEVDSELDSLIAVSSYAVYEGEKVTFSLKNNSYKIVSLYANGVAIPVVGDVYTLTVTENVTITGEVVYTEGGVTFDGVLSEDEGWTENVLSYAVTDYANEAKITLVGLNTETGIRIGVTVDHKIAPDTRVKEQNNNWSDWLNVELRLNGDYNVPVQAGTLDGYTANCRAAFRTVDIDENGYKYRTTFEIVVPHTLYNTSVESAVGICIGGCYDGGFNWLQMDGSGCPFMHHITKNGLLVLNGELNNFAWTEEVKSHAYTDANNRAKVEVTAMAVKLDYGVLMGVSINHNEVITKRLQGEPDKAEEWWNFQNVEVRLNGDTARQIAVTPWNHGATWTWFNYKTVTGTNGYAYKTTYELFVPNANIPNYKSGNVPVSFATVADNGFAHLFGKRDWEISHYITENGLVSIAGTDVDIDGVLDDEVWSTPKGQAHNYNYHGTTTTKVMGYTNENGIVLAMVANHKLPVETPLKPQENGGYNWSHYLNWEVRLAGDTDLPIQFNASVIDYYRCNCMEMWSTKQNADGTYTTTLEIFIPHSVKGTNATDPVKLYLGGVQSDVGFLWTWWDTTSYFVTPNGLTPTVPANIDGVLDDTVWTETVMSAEHTLNYEVTYADTNIASSKVAINGVKVNGGVMFAVTMQHNKGIYECVGDNEAMWEHYNNIRFNLFAVQHEVAAYSPKINGRVGSFHSDVKSVENGDGAEYKYTTTYEVFIPESYYAGQDFSQNIALTLIVTIDDTSINFLGNDDMKAEDWLAVCGYITENGMISK